MSIFIGGAWAYANGSLHLGHIAGLLPGDILARYYRLKGEKVLYVSGSDCNGTPIEYSQEILPPLPSFLPLSAKEFTTLRQYVYQWNKKALQINILVI